MARIKWTNVALDVRRKARELVEDPEYLAALDRRLADGKAPRMMRLRCSGRTKKPGIQTNCGAACRRTPSLRSTYPGILGAIPCASRASE